MSKLFTLQNKIGIDARMYFQSGIGRYLRNLLDELGKIDRQNQYIVFLLKTDLDRVHLGNNFTKVGISFRWYGLAEQLQFPKILNAQKLDLMHFPHFNVPIFYRGKFIVTIHDLIHQNFQMKRVTSRGAITYKIKSFGYQKIMKYAIKKSTKIITVSNYVKNQIAQKWHIPGSKIQVTYEGVEEKLVEINKKIKPMDVKNVLLKFGITKQYLFYVGNAHPHKNIEGLIRAFGMINKGDLQLVLSGNDHYFWQRLKKENRGEGIIFTGFISDWELISLFKASRMLIVPSFEEGFGLPILEAMASGTAVLSSNRASLPEVGGEAVLYFNPENDNDLVKKIKQVLHSDKLRQSLIEKGNKRWQKFSWQALAIQTLRIYQDA